MKGKPQVIVDDFLPTSLGTEVADAFSVALKKVEFGFNVMDRDDVLSKQATETGDYYICRDRRADQYVTVEGDVEHRPGNDWTITVRAIRSKDKKVVFEKSIALASDSETLRPVNSTAGTRGRVAWVRSASDTAEAETPAKTPTNGRRVMPTCIYCPQPQFTGEAVKVRHQGTVLLNVEINGAGQAIEIRVVKALGCGLTPKAVDAVKGWRFGPATASDGKPMAVLTPVEVTFRLY